MARALIVRVNGACYIEDVVIDLDNLQLVVGGYLEIVAGTDWHLYCNEEGKLDGLPNNTLATVLTDRLRPGFAEADVLCGPVIFLGEDPKDSGESGDVPLRVINELLHAISDPEEAGERFTILRYGVNVHIYGDALGLFTEVKGIIDNGLTGSIEIVPRVRAETVNGLAAAMSSRPDVALNDHR